MPGKYIGITSHPVVDGVLTGIDSIKAKKFKELPKQVSKKGSAFWMSRNEKTLLIRTRQGVVNRLKIGGKYNTDYFDLCLLYLGEAIGRMEQLEADKKVAPIGIVYAIAGNKIKAGDLVSTSPTGEITGVASVPCEKPIHMGIGFDFLEELKAYKYNPKTHPKGNSSVKVFEIDKSKMFKIDDYVKWGTPLREGEIVAFIGTRNDAIIKSSNGDYTQVRLKHLEHAEKPIKVGDYVKTNEMFESLSIYNNFKRIEGTVLKLEDNWNSKGNTLATVCVDGKTDKISTGFLEHADKPDDDCIAVGDCVEVEYQYGRCDIGIVRGVYVSHSGTRVCDIKVEGIGIRKRNTLGLKKIPAKKDDCKIEVGDIVRHGLLTHLKGDVKEVRNRHVIVIVNGCEYTWEFYQCELVCKKPKPKRAICVGDTVRTTEEYNNDPRGKPLCKGRVLCITDTDQDGLDIVEVGVCDCERTISTKWLEHVEPNRK